MSNLSRAQPRTPTREEFLELLALVNADKPVELTKDHAYLEDSYLAVFDNYRADNYNACPAYRGKILVAVWPNNPANVEVFGWVNGVLEPLD